MKHPEYNQQSHSSDDVDSLARDADRRRDRIEKTLDVLGGKLSPEHIKDQAFDLFREHGGDIASGLQRSVRNNPVPLLLTGVGIAWMMMSQRDDQRRTGHYGQYAQFRQPPMDTRYIPERKAFSDRDHADGSSDEGLADKLSDAGDTLRNEASRSWDSVTESARDLRDATGERLESMRDHSAEVSGRLRQQYNSAAHGASQTAEEWANDASRFMREQPLVAGALGIALGALLGGLVPTSNKERQLARRAVNSDVGKTAVERSTEALRTAKDKASSHIEKASDVAREKVKDVKASATTEA